MLHTNDLATLGAQTLSTRDLVGILLPKTGSDDVRTAEEALSLVGPARDAAIRAHPAGPRLLAAVELGRRAWMLPSPAGRRMRAPVDVAAVIAPRSDVDATWALALDKRMTLARVAVVDERSGAVLRAALGAGCDRVIVARRRPERAVPTSADEDFAHSLLESAALVGVSLVDVVVLGDDGFCSLLRLGMLPHTDVRYR